MNEKRENLFRGKRKKDGKWVEGYYVFQDVEVGDKETHHFILTHDEFGFLWHEVDPATIGQYTGMTGENGTRIFEGDIVHVYDAMVQYSAPFHEYEGCVDHFCGSFRVNCGDHTHYRWADYEVTVIGNIHDNPELLEAQ